MEKPRIDATYPPNPKARYTYKDYKTWPEDERWELIYGVPYSMSPAPRRMHQTLTVQLAALLDTFFAGKPCRPHIAPVDVFLDAEDGILEEAELVVQPDLLVVCDPSKLMEEGIRGAPDFIIEILSPTSALRDQTEKREIYEKYGVREYWVVNPKTLEVFMYTLKGGEYGLPVPASLKTSVPVGIFPGLSLKLRVEDL